MAYVTLISSSPAHTAETVDVATNIVLTFSAAIKPGPGKVEMFDWNGKLIFSEAMSSGHVSITGETMTIDPPANLPHGTSFYLSFSSDSLLDGDGMNVFPPNDFRFTTALSPVAVEALGTDAGEQINGSNLGDHINGAGGADQLFGFSGDDALAGGNGNDILYGGAGNDVLKGESDNDHLDGNAGDDTLEGGDGNDTLADAEGSNILNAGAGNDAVHAEGGYNLIDAGQGDDWIRANVSDNVVAGDGDDSIWLRAQGNGRSGSADGGAGKDRFEIHLNRMTDATLTLKGGSGSDTFVLNPLKEGQGSYRCIVTDFETGVGGDQLDLGYVVNEYGSGDGNPFGEDGFLRLQADGADTLLILKSGDETTLLRFMSVAPSQFTTANFVGGYSPSGDTKGLTLQGTAGADTLSGFGLDDSLYGAEGIDYLQGGGGNDLLEGGPESAADGGDFLDGGTGDDRLRGGAGDDILRGGAGNDLLEGGSGNDVLADSSGSNELHGGAGADTISMDGGDFVATGGDGDDSLNSTGGSGSMAGGGGRDILTLGGSNTVSTKARVVHATGEEGDDTLIVAFPGNEGGDFTMAGGTGADTYTFLGTSGSGSWIFTISDFAVTGGDRIDLTGLLPSNFQGNPFGTAGHFELAQAGPDSVLWFDRDGAADTGNGPVKLVTLLGVTASQLTSNNFVKAYAPNGSTIGNNLVGTSGNDTLVGTPMDDHISGLGGRDRLIGGDGNDTLDGGDEPDSADGDTLDGDAGDDILKGGGGRDSLRGGTGDDQLFGGSGDDNLQGNDGSDRLDGGDGKDVMSGGVGDDTLLGGAGDDILEAGNGGNDRLEGGTGNDFLGGGSGISTLNGDAGDDTIRVAPIGGDLNATRITLSGGDGNDTITFAASFDSSIATIDASGGTGRDIYVLQSKVDNKITIKDFATGAGGDILEVMHLFPADLAQNPFGTPGYLCLVQSGSNVYLQFDQDGAAGTAFALRDYITFPNTTLAAFTRENFAHGISHFGDNVGETLVGGSTADILTGAFLDDDLSGMAGDDILSGGAGNDRLDGGVGADRLQGGEGDDLLAGGDGNDTLGDVNGSNGLEGGAGDDLISSGGTGNSRIFAGEGNDRIYVAGGNCIIAAEGGADIIEFNYVHSGADLPKPYFSLADGGDGNDVFQLSANKGIEAELWGKAGRDTYVLNSGAEENKYVVADFTAGAGGDLIDFTSLVGREPPTINPFAPGGSMQLRQDGANAVLYWDRDGNGPLSSRAILTLNNVHISTLTGSNFVGGYPPDGSLTAAAITGTEQFETLNGTGMHDTIDGAGGGDRIFGKGGNDLINGGAGNDTLDGGAGDDTLDGGADNDFLFDEWGNNTLRGGAGNDNLDSNSVGISLLEGGVGNDTLRGGRGTDTLDGGEGDDRITLSSQTQFEPYPTRAVKAYGGIGNDTITIGYVSDINVRAEVWGGVGADNFRMWDAANPPQLIIMDFDATSGDTLTLEGVRKLSGYTEGNPFANGFLRLVQAGQDTQVFAKSGVGEKLWFTLANVAADTLTYQAFSEGFDPNAATAVVLKGGAQADRIVAGDQADVLSGEGGNDTLMGLAGDDTLNGGDGNDLLAGGNGNDRLDGGAGIDTAQVQSPSSATKVWVEKGLVHVQDLKGAGGTDVLTGVERLMLADRSIALDVEGNAGKIYRIYQAAFDRAPDSVGIGFWIAQADLGTSVAEVAKGFVLSDEFKALYGAAPTNQELVNRLYQNVLHRAGDQGGIEFWLGVLDSKAATVAEVLAGFAESPENVAAIARVIGNGFEYTPWVG
jgi:Ca2+-binding RTX toxin-like protein